MESDNQTTTDMNDLVLPEGWKVIVIEKDRLVYINEVDKTWSWLPPVEAWKSERGLSFGWELAQSVDSKRYYINHLKKETFRELPLESELSSIMIPPRTRKIVISRHSDIGYGFVAGSEKPVLIRSVAEDGPSAGKLYANDQILKINGEDVCNMPQSDVIHRIKESTEELNLEVIASDDVQDVRNRGQRKSSIMSRSTRERRRSNPVSVRFAEAPVLVQYVGSPPSTPIRRSSLPLIPNVLKIFLENGQTRSFLYNSSTIVKDMFFSLADKIGLKRLDRFSLVLQATQTIGNYIIQANERVAQIYTRRNCSSSAWLAKLHLIFAPKDIHLFLKEDPVAFDYFYRQMCSQVVEGRFGWELKYETAIKLAALHLQQYALEEKIGKGGKISVKTIEREVGSLNNFVSTALINTMQKKDLQRVLTQQIKQTRNLCPPGQKYISPVQAKLQYLKICSEMKTYGGKQFNAVIVDPTAEDQKLFQDQKLNSVIFVGANVGLAQVTNPRSFSMDSIAEFSQITGLVITPHTEGKQNVKLFLNNGKSITLIMGPIHETRDLVYLMSGYHKHLVQNARPLSVIDMTSSGDVEEQLNEMPSYSDTHRVLLDDFNYLRNGDENENDVREIEFNYKPDFEDNELYSLADHSKNIQPSPPLSNGNVKTHLSILVNNKQVLNSIEEETLSPTSPRKDDKTETLENGIYVNGVAKRKLLVHLNDDLNSESNDEQIAKNTESESEIVEEVTKEEADSGPVVSITMTGSNEVRSPSRNHSSIHVTSPTHKIKPVINNIEGLCNGDIFSRIYDVQVDIPLTPSVQSTASSTSDNVSSLSTSLDNSSKPSPVPGAILLSNESTNEVVSGDSDGTSTVTDEAEVSKEDESTNNSDEEVHSIEAQTDQNDHIETNLSSNKEIQSNGIDACDSNRLEMLTNEDNNLQNSGLICAPSETKENSDLKSLSFRQRRRRSSGYIPHRTLNGDLHHNMYAPECIICGDISADVRQVTEESRSHDEQITSRSDACDHTLKTFYLLKAKLNTLQHSTHSVRTTNEILRSKKQSMLEEIAVLEKCNEQMRVLTTAKESNVVEAILRTKSSLSQLTDFCILIYNAQYSMKHFISELIESIDKHIDVLITTDAWDAEATIVSDLTIELHKDKCELVHESLDSLRKIVNSL